MEPPVWLHELKRMTVKGGTLATENTIWPLRALVDLLFSLASSSSSERPGSATALS